TEVARDDRPGNQVEHEQHALIVDLSESGLRLQRPLRGRRAGRIVQLEFELPEADEIVWAKGEGRFDELWRGGAGGGPRRTSGVRLVAAAQRHLRMLRDYVMARREHLREIAFSVEEEPLLYASHWNG